MANTSATKEQARGTSHTQTEKGTSMADTLTTNNVQARSTRRGTQGNANRRQASRQNMGGRQQQNQEEQLARGLGWFSLGLGLTELLAPRTLSKLIGVRANHESLIRMVGLRELTSGIGILMNSGKGQRPSGWLWSRVAGDAMDLSLLGAAFATPRAQTGRLIAATAAVAGVTALDAICAQELSRKRSRQTASGALRVQCSLSIKRSATELYQFWRDFQQLPRFMYHLESVQVTNDLRSHWVAKGPAGSQVEWDAEITKDQPNQRIAWRSLPNADVANSGSVTFERAPGERGTIVQVQLEYSPPAGVVGATLAKLFGEEPEQQLKEDLRRFKQVMETGEVTTTAGQPSGRPADLPSKYDLTVRQQDVAPAPMRSRSATSR